LVEDSSSAFDSAELAEIQEPQLTEARAGPYGAALHSGLNWLVQNWILICVGALAGLVASTTLGVQPPQYMSEALVALVPQRTQVQLDASTTETSGPTPTDTLSVTVERRQALADLLTNARVEADTIERLKATLPGTRFASGELLPIVHGGLKPRSEIIAVDATADTAAEAVAIADAWAASYVDFVNGLYAAPSGPSLQLLGADRDRAAVRSAEAQARYTASLQTSQVEQLTYQINQREAELTQLAPPSLSAVVTREGYGQLDAKQLNDVAQALRRIDDARWQLRLVLNSGPADMTPATTETSLTLIKAQLVALSSGLPGTVRLSIPADESVTTREDLLALINGLDAARQGVAVDLSQRRAEYEARVRAREDQLNAELRVLRSQLEQANAERGALAAERDLAANTYTLLAQRYEEQRLEQAVAGRDVTLASRAATPILVTSAPLQPRVAGVLGGIALAIAITLIARSAVRVANRRAAYFGSAG
jgi:hypothetical protein